MRVLVFEDSYDVAAMLAEGGVDLSGIDMLQKWNTMDCFKRIREFGPDVLLLDHFIPPTKGLEVLCGLLELVAAGQIDRPRVVLGISSSGEANEAMEYAGADGSVVKFKLAEHEVWNR